MEQHQKIIIRKDHPNQARLEREVEVVVLGLLAFVLVMEALG